MNEYDQYQNATPPDRPWICEECGGEVAEEDIVQIPTATRYVSTNLCPHCAAEYYDRQRETAELIREEYQ